MASLEEYGDLYTKVCLEGKFGIFDYGNPVEDVDPELSAIYEDASRAVKRFEKSLESKIRKLGGDPEDYEA